jgi:glutathione S-transferase
VFQGLVRTAPEKRDNAAITAAITEAANIWGILDRQLAEHAYVAGDAFTLADIPFGVHAHRWLNMEIPGRPEAPALRAWYGRLVGRAAYKTHCAGGIT